MATFTGYGIRGTLVSYGGTCSLDDARCMRTANVPENAGIGLRGTAA